MSLLILVTVIKINYSINNIHSKYTKDITNIIGIVTYIKKEDNKIILTIKAK